MDEQMERQLRAFEYVRQAHEAEIDFTPDGLPFDEWVAWLRGWVDYSLEFEIADAPYDYEARFFMVTQEGFPCGSLCGHMLATVESKNLLDEVIGETALATQAIRYAWMTAAWTPWHPDMPKFLSGEIEITPEIEAVFEAANEYGAKHGVLEGFEHAADMIVIFAGQKDKLETWQCVIERDPPEAEGEIGKLNGKHGEWFRVSSGVWGEDGPAGRFIDRAMRTVTRTAGMLFEDERDELKRTVMNTPAFQNLVTTMMNELGPEKVEEILARAAGADTVEEAEAVMAEFDAMIENLPGVAEGREQLRALVLEHGPVPGTKEEWA